MDRTEEKNYCNKLICKAKNEFVESQLQECSKDPKKFWRVISRTFGDNSTESRPTITLVDPESSVPILDADSPNFMNDYLVSAAPKLASKLPDIPFNCYFPNFLSQLRLSRITVDETIKVVSQIDISKSSAVENLTSRVLKDAFSAIPIHLAFLFNLSIDSGIFPDRWKRANLILVPKEGLSSDPANYRPISLLPLPGKLLEKLVQDRLFCYLTDNNILTDREVFALVTLPLLLPQCLSHR